MRPTLDSAGPIEDLTALASEDTRVLGAKEERALLRALALC